MREIDITVLGLSGRNYRKEFLSISFHNYWFDGKVVSHCSRHQPDDIHPVHAGPPQLDSDPGGEGGRRYFRNVEPLKSEANNFDYFTRRRGRRGTEPEPKPWRYVWGRVGKVLLLRNGGRGRRRRRSGDIFGETGDCRFE